MAKNKIDFTQTPNINNPFAQLSEVKAQLKPSIEKGESPSGQNDSVKKKEYNFVAIFRLEKNGRGGKTVTVIDQLPKDVILIQNLTKELKTKCGTGGTYNLDGKEAIIEIQGDKREEIKKIFTAKGIKFKGM